MDGVTTKAEILDFLRIGDPRGDVQIRRDAEDFIAATGKEWRAGIHGQSGAPASFINLARARAAMRRWGISEAELAGV